MNLDRYIFTTARFRATAILVRLGATTRAQAVALAKQRGPL